MKKLKKLLFVSALLVVGMSSCNKIPDPVFELNMLNPYVSQLAPDRFVPYFYVQPTYYGNYIIKTAKATNGEQTYTLSNIGYGVQTADGQSSSSLPQGTFTITATNTVGETNSIAVTFDLKTDQIMSELVVDSLIYSVDEGIRAGWQPVENATAYCLVMTPVVTDSEENDILVEPSTEFIYWDVNNKKATSGAYRGGEALRGRKYKIAVAALSGTQRPNVIIQRDNHTAKIITWGEKSE